jgi:hypothetical protein
MKCGINRDKLEAVDNKRGQKETQVLGYVPIQIINLSLEEVELEGRMYIRVASPITVDAIQVPVEHDVNSILQGCDVAPNTFEGYLREKLTHLKTGDRRILEPMLRRYKHLFYGLGSKNLGSTSQVEHNIETGDARPIKRNPYRTPHALKPVVEEHIEVMLKRKIIETS